MFIHVERGLDPENPWWAYTADSPEDQINGYGATPEEALEDLKREMNKIFIREYWDFSTNPPSINEYWSETCAYIIDSAFQVYRQTDIGPVFYFDTENPPTDQHEIIDALSEV